MATSILMRARSAVSQFFMAPQQLLKAAPYLWNYAGETPLWHMINYLAYAHEGYKRNPLIHAAIMYKVRAANATRLQAWQGDEANADPAPRKHPLAKLLQRPNEFQSWKKFEALNLVYLNLSGNCYIWIERDRPGTPPTGMYPLRPDRVWIIPGEKGIKGYLYIPPGKTKTDGIPFLPEEIIHVKLPDPSDELEGQGYGQPPLAAAGQTVDMDNDLTKYMKLFMERGTILSGLLKFNIPMDTKQIGEVRRRWMDKYSGADHWAEIGVLDQGGDYKPLGTNFKDMDFSSIDERTETRTLLVLGVPGILLNTRSGLKNSTYANISEARRVFWEDTMTGELALFDDEYEHVLNDDAVFVRRDYSRVPALQKNTPDLIHAAHEAWTMGVPANSAFKTVGLPIKDIPNGDVSYIPGAVVVSGSTPVGAQPQGRSGKMLALPAPAGRKDMNAGDYCVLAPLPGQEQVKLAQDMLRGVLGDAGVTWLKPDTFHLTLCYGTGSRDQVMQVRLAGEMFFLIAEGVEVFETPDGYAVHLNIRRTHALLGYQDRVCSEMLTAGLTVSEYTLNYKPHITLAYSAVPVAPFSITPFVITVRQVAISDGDYRVILSSGLKSAMPEQPAPLTIPAQRKSSRWTDDQKALIWKAVDTIARNYEAPFGDDAAQAFEKDRRGIQVLVHEFGQESAQRKATLQWLDMIPRVNLYIRGKSPENWRTSFQSMGALLEATGQYWGAELGFAFNVRNLTGEAWFKEYQLTFSKPIGETTTRALHGMLELAQAEGWSIHEMTDRIDTLFKQWKEGDLTPEDFAWLQERLPPHRRELIARTETTRLQNAGTVELFKDWKVPRKEWLSTSDARTRPSHQAANRQVVDMDKPFKVGGYDMLYPGDMSRGAPVSEIADCRCTTLPDLDD